MKTSTNHKFTSIFISLSGVIAATIVHAAATRIMSVCISLMHTFRSIFLFFCSFGICSRCILSLYHLVYQRHKYWMSFHEIEFCVRMCYRRHRRCTSTNIPYKYTFHVRIEDNIERKQAMQPSNAINKYLFFLFIEYYTVARAEKV